MNVKMSVCMCFCEFFVYRRLLYLQSKVPSSFTNFFIGAICTLALSIILKYITNSLKKLFVL